MVYVIVKHKSENYDNWKPVFDEHGTVRREHGAAGHTLYRSYDNPNEVDVVNWFNDAAGARAFIGDPATAEAMKRAGVIEAPTIVIADRVEEVTY